MEKIGLYVNRAFMAKAGDLSLKDCSGVFKPKMKWEDTPQVGE